MIIMGLLEIVKVLLNVIFGWFSLPDVPSAVYNVIDRLFSYMQSGLGIFFIFFDRNFIMFLLPLVIAVVNFDDLYKLGMWILKKIPMIGID